MKIEIVHLNKPTFHFLPNTTRITQKSKKDYPSTVSADEGCIIYGVAEKKSVTPILGQKIETSDYFR